MRKHVISLVTVLVLAVGITLAGTRYFRFVSDMIYQESALHLTEIYHQANQALNSLVEHNWSTMRMWLPYLQDTQSDESVTEFVNIVKAEKGFTSFYFMSRNGAYLTVDGQTGYLDWPAVTRFFCVTAGCFYAIIKGNAGMTRRDACVQEEREDAP